MTTLIIGAGVIGTTLAHELALAGEKVTVVDSTAGPGLRRRQPHDCRGPHGRSARALAQLMGGAAPEIDLAPFAPGRRQIPQPEINS